MASCPRMTSRRMYAPDGLSQALRSRSVAGRENRSILLDRSRLMDDTDQRPDEVQGHHHEFAPPEDHPSGLKFK